MHHLNVRARKLIYVTASTFLLQVACSTAAAPIDTGPPKTDAGVLPSTASNADFGITHNDLGSVTPGTLANPPALKPYSGGTCPVLKYGATADAGENDNFMSAGNSRTFYVIVPPNYDGSSNWPVVMGWHWLGSSPSSMISTLDLINAATEEHFIAVLPDHLRKPGSSDKAYELEWPFVEAWGIPGELTFFDDMLTCVSQQLKVDNRRIWGIGASAGGLWLTYLSTTDRADYLASEVVVSGGLGNEVGVWQMSYVPQANKFPALVIWGGVTDWFILDFQDASEAYRDALKADNHFVATCTHTLGHAIPPFVAPTGKTQFYAFWKFFEAHPYATPAATDPYKLSGLPSFFPSWCTIP